MNKVMFEELEDINSVEMSNEMLLLLEANEIPRLQEIFATMWQIEQNIDDADDERERAQKAFNLTAPLDSTLETLTFFIERQVALNAMRYALVVCVRPAVLLLALLLELLAFVVLVRVEHKSANGASLVPSTLYLVLHVGACVVEDSLFHALECLANAFGIRHPATAHRLLCSFWWLGFKVVHAFPLWILLPATIRAGRYCTVTRNTKFICKCYNYAY